MKTISDITIDLIRKGEQVTGAPTLPGDWADISATYDAYGVATNVKVHSCCPLVQAAFAIDDTPLKTGGWEGVVNRRVDDVQYWLEEFAVETLDLEVWEEAKGFYHAIDGGICHVRYAYDADAYNRGYDYGLKIRQELWGEEE